jgi:HlyD family secretion protein
MNITKIIKWSLLGLIVIGAASFTYIKFGKKKEKDPYKAEKITRRTIVQAVRATGTLEAEGTINIGSLINGTVESLHAEENQIVKKGQLLAVIDDGKGDTDVKKTLGLLDQARAQLTYQKAYYAREKKLFDAGLISQDEFDQAQQSHDAAVANVAAQDAAYQQAVLQFDEKRITSPINGIVITKHVSLREGVANFSPPTILYTLAEDIRRMQVELEIDETDIGLIQIGLEAKLYFDTYPHTSFRGKIYEISSGPSKKGSSVIYKAKIKIDNSSNLLKPGMTAHAQIVVGVRKDSLSVPGHLFGLDARMLQAAAQQKHYEFKPLNKTEKTKFRAQLTNKNRPVKTVWIVQNNAIIQKPIELGITDNAYFEVVSGLTGQENLIIDVDEPDLMLKMYQQLFGGGLGKK